MVLKKRNGTTGSVATFKKQSESDWSGRPGSVSCNHLEQLVDELNLLPNIRIAHPPRLPLPNPVHGQVRPTNVFERRRSHAALLHESSLARTRPTDRILTGRGDMTLVGRVRSAD